MHLAPISSLDWNPEMNSILLTGSTDKHVKVFNLNDLNKTEQILDISSYAGIGNVKWSPKSKYEFCASFAQNNEINLFQYHMAMPYFPSSIFSGHTDAIADFYLFKKGKFSLFWINL